MQIREFILKQKQHFKLQYIVTKLHIKYKQDKYEMNTALVCFKLPNHYKHRDRD